MVLVANTGLVFAPAAHAGASFPGIRPLLVALLATWVLREASGLPKRIGFTLALIGVVGIVWSAGGALGSRQNVGHLLFVGAAMLWACYTVAKRKARLERLMSARRSRC